MKKKLLSVLLIGTLILTVTGCGKSTESNNNNIKGSSDSQVVDKVDSIKDNNIYYVMINGKKIKAGDKITTVESFELKLRDKDLEKTIPTNRYLLANPVLNASGKEVISFVALNDTDDTINYKDAVIGGFQVGDYNTSKVSEDTLALNVEIVGGIKLGSSVDDLHRVFGEEDFKHETEPSTKVNRPGYTTYKYSSGSKGFEFIVDDSGKVSKIKWHNYNYNDK